MPSVYSLHIIPEIIFSSHSQDKDKLSVWDCTTNWQVILIFKAADSSYVVDAQCITRLYVKQAESFANETSKHYSASQKLTLGIAGRFWIRKMNNLVTLCDTAKNIFIFSRSVRHGMMMGHWSFQASLKMKESRDFLFIDSNKKSGQTHQMIWVLRVQCHFCNMFHIGENVTNHLSTRDSSQHQEDKKQLLIALSWACWS